MHRKKETAEACPSGHSPTGEPEPGRRDAEGAEGMDSIENCRLYIESGGDLQGRERIEQAPQLWAWPCPAGPTGEAGGRVGIVLVAA